MAPKLLMSSDLGVNQLEPLGGTVDDPWSGYDRVLKAYALRCAKGPVRLARFVRDHCMSKGGLARARVYDNEDAELVPDDHAEIISGGVAHGPTQRSDADADVELVSGVPASADAAGCDVYAATVPLEERSVPIEPDPFPATLDMDMKMIWDPAILATGLPAFAVEGVSFSDAQAKL